MPTGVGEALEAIEATLSEAYQPDDRIPPLPSLQAEARREWWKGHKARVDVAVVGVVMAVRAAAPDLYAQCGARMAEAIQSRDDRAYTEAALRAVHLRGFLGHVEGRPQGSNRTQRLTPAAPEWVLSRPDVWFEDPETYRPRITATWLADHPDVEPGCYTPDEVVANLQALGSKR
jgi:hypothetical protein